MPSATQSLIPAETLQQLGDDGSQAVRDAAKANPLRLFRKESARIITQRTSSVYSTDIDWQSLEETVLQDEADAAAHQGRAAAKLDDSASRPDATAGVDGRPVLRIMYAMHLTI